MLSKVIQRSAKRTNLAKMMLTQARTFSHGPYNPLAYKTMLLPEEMPS